MKTFYQLILASIAAGGLLALTGCASDEPATRTTTTTTEEIAAEAQIMRTAEMLMQTVETQLTLIAEMRVHVQLTADLTAITREEQLTATAETLILFVLTEMQTTHVAT